MGFLNGIVGSVGGAVNTVTGSVTDGVDNVVDGIKYVIGKVNDIFKYLQILLASVFVFMIGGIFMKLL